MMLMTNTRKVPVAAAFGVFFLLSALPHAAHSMNISSYSEALIYVDGSGMVDYQGLKADRVKLDAFVESLGEVSEASYNKWPNTRKIAFWINAYNALTLRAIIDHYPIKSSFAKSVIYPKNSIRQIPGVWDKLKFKVMGRELTLEHIEHRILRKQFNEPRIHMALVCAAKSCPPLRMEPYKGARLSAQLDDQAQKFLRKSTNFRIDHNNNRIYISPIFKWFGDDFLSNYGVKENYSGHSESETAVRRYINSFLKQEDRDFLKGSDFPIHYLKYDWSLNEKKGK
jgi:Protein of unknown function, DUF547